MESRFAVRHTPPDEQDPRFDRSAPTQVRFLRFALRHTPPDQQAPHFDCRRYVSVINPVLCHIDPACNTSYHFAASRTVLPRVPPYLARDRLRLLAHVYDSVASIHMTENPGRHG